MNRRLVLLSALILFAVAPSRAEMVPAVDAVSLMDVRFYEQRGAFLVENLQLVFPEQAKGALRLVIRRAGGGEVAGVDLRSSAMAFESFADLYPQGPGVLEIGQAGDYTIGVQLDGRMITAFPFVLHAAASDDPYAATKEFTRDGPWSELAYLAQQTAQSDEALTLHWWSRLAQTGGSQAPCSAQLVLAGHTVARTETPAVVSTATWQHLSRRLVTAGAQSSGFTHAMLVAHDGAYTVRLECGGKQVAGYSLRVAEGRVFEIPRTRLGHKPQTEFLPPRRIDTSSGSSSSYKMQSLFWMTAAK